MKWRAWFVIAIALGIRAAAAQVVAPTIEVSPERDSATIGDSIALRVRVRLDERDLLLDSLPRLAAASPSGMRVLVVDRVVRQPDRTFTGTIVVAFYRTGRRNVPSFALTYRRNASFIGAPILSEPAAVEILPVLPAGSSHPLQDIKDLEPVPAGDLALLGVATLVLAALLVLGLVVRRRRHARGPPSTVAVQSGRYDALEAALGRLDEIEREHWPAREEVARHYEMVATVLRDYLATSVRIPARERTTAEIVAALPASLSPDGTRERWRRLLQEADLVKFAGVRPIPSEAERFLHGARKLLTDWATDAVR